MSKIDRRIAELGIKLPKPWTLPPGLTVPASLVRVRGKRVLVSGHVPINADGSVAGPFGRVGVEVSPEQGQQAARVVLIGILASLKQSPIGSPRGCGMVSPAPGFTAFPLLMNGASSLIQEVFGPEIGDHARLAIGVGVQRPRGDRGGIRIGVIGDRREALGGAKASPAGTLRLRPPAS